MRKIYFFFLLVFASILPAAAQMSGTYTVDATGIATANNYLTVSAAVSDLVSGTRSDGGPVNGPGVNGPVIVRLVTGSGPYVEQVTISGITGASATNSVRITGGPGREMITYSGTTTADRHVIKINGARHIILDSLTLVNTDATYGYGVHITNSADSNVVSNCSVITSTSSTSTNFAGITISGATVATVGDWGDANLIQNNSVNGGYYGITMRGTSNTVFNQRNKVIGNVIQNYYYYGVYCYHQNMPEVIGNTITARATATALGYAVYMYYSDLFKIEKNKISTFGTYGVYCYYGNYQAGTGNTRATIVNNMIGGGCLDTSPYGIYLSTNCRYLDIFHNSVSLDYGNGRCIYITSGTGNDVRNNSFAIFGSTTGYALYVTSTAYVSNVNYNNYHAPGSANFIYIAAAYSTSTYVGGGGYNANSRNGDPLYINNASNLHTNAMQLYDGGTNVGVTTDIDGQTRPLAPSLLYDMGADEFTPVLNDASVAALTNPVIPFGPGVQNVTVVLFNYGSNTLTSATVNWDVNMILQTPYAWTGSLATYNSSSPTTIGTFNFLPGNTYNVRIWTTNPNGSPDQETSNDTLYATLCVGLNGVYSIGGVGADFPTITAAVNAAACGGVTGPVTFRLTAGAGPFNEQVIIPPIPGTSATKQLRITGGANRETVTFGATTTTERSVFKINGARHIILDSMKINNTGTTYGYGVHITNSADSNIVRNCIVNVNTTSTSTNFAGITMSGSTVAASADNGDDNLVEYNTVNGGYYGITMHGTSTTVFNQRNIVRGNTVYNTYYYAIYCYYQNQVQVVNNNISERPLASTAGYGIYMYYSNLFTITGNDLDSCGAYGIYTYYGNYQAGTGTTHALIANNMVGGTWRGTTPYGIYLSTNSRYIDIWHNSVSLTSGNGRALYISSGLQNNVRNNSFAVFGSATGYAAYVTSAANIVALDYNNYYAPGSSNFIYVAGAYTTSNYIGGGGWNANSRNGDPGYAVNANNLHATNPQLYDGGTNVGITVDIDGDARPLAPSTGYDIGADEFTATLNDNDVVQLLTPANGNCPDSNATVSVVITNLGANAITTMPITAQVTGYTTATLNYTYTGNLTYGQSDTVVVGLFNSFPGGTLNIAVYSTLVGDQNISNDTVNATINITTLAPAAVGANDTTCTGTSATLMVNTDGFNHTWYDAATGGNLVGAGDVYITPVLTATTTYYVQSANMTCANPVRTPITVVVTTPPVVALGNDTTVCGSHMLDAGNPGLTYLWSTVQTTQQITVTTSGQYIVAVSDDYCTGYDTINMIVNPNPTLVITAEDGNICAGTSDTLYVTGGTTYNWSTGGTGSMEIVTPVSTTTYTVTGSNMTGCVDTETFTITVNALPNVTLSLPIDTACLTGGNISLAGESPSGGTWSGPGVSGNSFDPVAAGSGTWAITYDYTDANGCSGTAIDSVLVDPCLGIETVRPGVFTVYPNPNNGTFTLQLSGNGVMSISIYDATGRLVMSDSKTEGTYSINLTTPGIYQLRITGEDGVQSAKTIIVE